MKSDRPVNLNIFTIQLPFAAIASITHRITGAVLFVGMAFALYALQLALSSPQGFEDAQLLLSQPLAMFIMWALLFVVTYHALAGIKHLLLDFHIGDTVAAAHMASIVVVVGSILITGALGGYVMVTQVLSLSRSGLTDFVIQRVTAVILLVYTLCVLGFFLSVDVDYAALTAWFFIHAHAGIQHACVAVDARACVDRYVDNRH